MHVNVQRCYYLAETLRKSVLVGKVFMALVKVNYQNITLPRLIDNVQTRISALIGNASLYSLARI